GIRGLTVTGVQTCALPISGHRVAGHLPVHVGLERPAGGAGLRGTAARADHVCAEPADAYLLHEHRRDRPRRVPVDGGTAGRLLRPTALLRPGGAGRFGQVAGGTGYPRRSSNRHATDRNLGPAHTALTAQMRTIRCARAAATSSWVTTTSVSPPA